MNTSTIPRYRLHRIDGEKKAMNYELPLDEFAGFALLAEHRGWSLAEATRRGVRLLLDQNKDIVNILLSEAEARNGADDEPR
jgi:hypothetical protein